MKFGRVENPEIIDFTLPVDHLDTNRVLEKYKDDNFPEIHVGCSKWNRAELKGFYPRGTKDELEYYSRQFNCIELNATFYRIFPNETFIKWHDRTPNNFKFFIKMYQRVSHWNRLLDVDDTINSYLYAAANLRTKLGGVFIQFNKNFAPKDFDRVVQFIEKWPKDIPLAIEFRHTNWYNDKSIAEDLFQLLENHGIANIIVDTAGRRDLMHMRLTNHSAFIRFVGTNHESDFTRLDDWVKRLEKWQEQGIKQINFFVHQNTEKRSPELAQYFINKLNAQLKANIKVPQLLTSK